MNLSVELYHLPNNFTNWHTLLLNRAISAYYAQYRYRSPTIDVQRYTLAFWRADPTGLVSWETTLLYQSLLCVVSFATVGVLPAVVVTTVLLAVLAILALRSQDRRRIVHVVSLVVSPVSPQWIPTLRFDQIRPTVLHISLSRTLCCWSEINHFLVSEMFSSAIRVVSTFLLRWIAGAPDRFRNYSLLRPGRCLYRSSIQRISLVACISLCHGALRVLVVGLPRIPAYSLVLVLARHWEWLHLPQTVHRDSTSMVATVSGFRHAGLAIRWRWCPAGCWIPGHSLIHFSVVESCRSRIEPYWHWCRDRFLVCFSD